MCMFYHMLIYATFFISFYAQSESNSISVFDNNIEKTTHRIIKALSTPLTKETLHGLPRTITKPLPIFNRLLLYGTYRSDTIAYVQELAKTSHCHILSMDARRIISDPYQGDGAASIQNLFNDALSTAQKSSKPVILCIEGIDTMATQAAIDSSVECRKSTAQLKYLLDEHKEDPRIFIICTLDKHVHLDDALAQYFFEKLKITTPNAEARKNVLTSLASQYDMIIDDNLMAELVYYSDGMSAQNLEDFISRIRMLNFFEKPLTHKQFIAEIKSHRPLYKNIVGNLVEHAYEISISVALITTGYLLYKKCFNKKHK